MKDLKLLYQYSRAIAKRWEHQHHYVTLSVLIGNMVTNEEINRESMTCIRAMAELHGKADHVVQHAYEQLKMIEITMEYERENSPID